MQLRAPMPASSLVTHFAKRLHWDGARDEDAVSPDHEGRPGDLNDGEREITPAQPIYSCDYFPRRITCCCNASPAGLRTDRSG
jgi:hypothetical protein